MVLNKITWQKIAGVNEPGRYQFPFGWLVVAAEDFAVGEKFPNAVFTLVKMKAANDAGEEFRLGTFELGEDRARGEE